MKQRVFSAPFYVQCFKVENILKACQSNESYPRGIACLFPIGWFSCTGSLLHAFFFFFVKTAISEFGKGMVRLACMLRWDSVSMWFRKFIFFFGLQYCPQLNFCLGKCCELSRRERGVVTLARELIITDRFCYLNILHFSLSFTRFSISTFLPRHPLPLLSAPPW